MPDFRVIARRYKDSVEFYIKDSADIKSALKEAREEANRVFDYDGTGEPPGVSIKPIEPESE